MCACQKSYTLIIMTSITWAGPRCVQEAAAILGPQNRTQRRCEWLILRAASNFPTAYVLISFADYYSHIIDMWRYGHVTQF